MSKNSKEKLGLGLKALLSNKDIAPQKTDVKVDISELSGVAMIPLSSIEANPFQPRTEFDQDALLELVQSIKSYGIIQPLTVRKLNDHTFQIISGERRYRASKLANLVEVPAYIRIADDNEVLEMALVENIQRADLNALEVALTYKRLIDECSINHEILADRVGKKRSTVSNYIRLLKLPPAVQKALKEELISMGHARAILSLDNPEQVNHVSNQVIARSLSVRDTEALIRSLKDSTTVQKPSPTVAQPSIEDQVISQYRKLLSTELGSKVNIERNTTGKGKIVITFNNNDELSDIIDYFEN
jgi:ParB family transcriptional regulator, chromosome partitioning protein